MSVEAKRRQMQEEGFCIIEGVLSNDALERARAGLAHGVELARQKQGTAHDARIDPNEANLRVYNLPAVDPVFIELLRDETALTWVREVLGPHFLVSNFTANVALPGSGSMRLHSDQALVIPPPWLHSWAMNIIWCLDDVREENGATRFLPGSHRFRTFEDVPADASEKTLAFEAPAGSFIAMEGRVWHTSGANVTKDEQRRLLFAYYSSDFIRPQANWAFALPAEVQAGMDAQTLKMFALEAAGNHRIGGGLTRLANNA
jgi:ectoine hydroxylase-related dioxygenase (phytanoyl-CoA dioxygenase family)